MDGEKVTHRAIDDGWVALEDPVEQWFHDAARHVLAGEATRQTRTEGGGGRVAGEDHIIDQRDEGCFA